jgi:hypothetical protein
MGVSMNLNNKIKDLFSNTSSLHNILQTICKGQLKVYGIDKNNISTNVEYITLIKLSMQILEMNSKL